MANVHISLNPQMALYLENLLAGGSYTSKSEVINEALREMEKRDLTYQTRLAVLRKELQIGLDQIEKGDLEDVTLQQMLDRVKVKKV
jgi:antitoxin ParD1/3/4